MRVCVLNNQSLKNHLVDEYILSCSHFSGYVPGILIPGPSKMKGKDLVLWLCCSLFCAVETWNGRSEILEKKHSPQSRFWPKSITSKKYFDQLHNP